MVANDTIFSTQYQDDEYTTRKERRKGKKKRERKAGILSIV
jgi:hypothetical protein